MKLPEKIVNDFDNEPREFELMEKVNEIIDFIEYFIRETEKCCICNGCPRHPKMEFIARSKDEIEETDTRKSVCNDCYDGDHIQCSWGECQCSCVSPRPKKDKGYEIETLAGKFRDFRSKYGSGSGQDYWEGLEKVARDYIDDEYFPPEHWKF